MKIVLTAQLFFAFSSIAVNHQYISTNNSPYDFHRPENYTGFIRTGAFSEFGNGRINFSKPQLDSIPGVNHFVNLLFCKEGKIGIGTQNPDKDLTVAGTIHAREVKLDLDIPVPDYVFEEGYALMSLVELEAYISENGHLPDIPSAEGFRSRGLNMAEMDMMLLRKVEELTLYLISNHGRLNTLDRNMKDREIAIDHIDKVIEQLDDLEKQISSAKDE